MKQHSVKLTFQEDRFSRNWPLIDCRVRAMAYEVAYRADLKGYATIVTSAIRADGIHGMRAAIDLDFIQREPVPTFVVPDYHDHGRMQAFYLNQTFKYGRSWTGRKLHCAVWHGGDSFDTTAGWHLHIQAPPGRTMTAKDIS